MLKRNSYTKYIYLLLEVGSGGGRFIYFKYFRVPSSPFFPPIPPIPADPG